jgi:hypothetical protein
MAIVPEFPKSLIEGNLHFKLIVHSKSQVEFKGKLLSMRPAPDQAHFIE